MFFFDASRCRQDLVALRTDAGDVALGRYAKPTFLSGPYKFHIRVYIKNLQRSRVW